MQVRYRETGKTDQVELRHDVGEGPVLVGRGNPFWMVGCRIPFYLEIDAVPDPDDEYFIWPETFDEWEIVEATDVERCQLRAAGFRLD